MIPQRASALTRRPHVKNTLRGFFDLALPSGMVLRGCTLLVKGDHTWVGLPGRWYAHATAWRRGANVIDFSDRWRRTDFRVIALQAAQEVFPEAPQSARGGRSDRSAELHRTRLVAGRHASRHEETTSRGLAERKARRRAGAHPLQTEHGKCRPHSSLSRVTTPTSTAPRQSRPPAIFYRRRFASDALAHLDLIGAPDHLAKTEGIKAIEYRGLDGVMLCELRIGQDEAGLDSKGIKASRLDLLHRRANRMVRMRRERRRWHGGDCEGNPVGVPATGAPVAPAFGRRATLSDAARVLWSAAADQHMPHGNHPRFQNFGVVSRRAIDSVRSSSGVLAPPIGPAYRRLIVTTCPLPAGAGHRCRRCPGRSSALAIPIRSSASRPAPRGRYSPGGAPGDRLGLRRPAATRAAPASSSAQWL